MNNFAFTKVNFILIGISMLIVIIGFLMMTGASSEESFNPEIFSGMRIKIAPIVCLIGFISIIPGILYRSKKNS